MSPATTTLGVIAAAVGAGLIYSAITGQAPLDELRKVLESGKLDGAAGRRPLAVADLGKSGQLGGKLDGGTSTSTGADGPADPTNLVPIGQGSHRLTAPAAAAFKAAEQRLGRPIKVTDSYRSFAQQQAAHRSDPQRFADPAKSAHPEGVAVDVNLGAMGCTTGRRGDPAYDRLYAALTGAGWCTYTGGTSGDTWHFSFGVCK